jgi:hypothetical protein
MKNQTVDAALVRCVKPFALLALAACSGIFPAGCGGGGSSGAPSPMVTMSVSPSSIPAGQTATLTWSSTNASTCTASGAWTDPVSTSGSLGVSPSAPATYTYNLSCSSSGSSAATGSATLTVVPAQLAITTAALANGVIGTPYNATIQATGGVAPFAWTVSSGALPHNLSLSPSTTNAVTISGTPDTVAQAVAFTIQVTDSGHHTASQPFTVSILLQADTLVLSPASLVFGNQIVGSPSSALTETLTNTETSAIVITSIAISGSNAAEFNQTSTTCGASLAAGASCAVNLIFTPSQPGPRTAALTINDDTAGSPQSVPLNGVGLTAGPNATLSVAGVTFGTQLVGTKSPAMSVVLTNYGSVTLSIGSIAASPTFFAETDNCLPSLASQAPCVISVTFIPGGSGNVTGTVSITDDAAGSPQKVSLSGTGSTMTPLLTGYCYSLCKPPAKVAQCPAGLPAETPGNSRCPVGVIGHVGTPVDLDRPCTVPPGGFQDRGYCVTE